VDTSHFAKGYGGTNPDPIPNRGYARWQKKGGWVAAGNKGLEEKKHHLQCFFYLETVSKV
jgi:hypothetical protein